MTFPLGPVNVELLQKVKQHILQEPRRLNMSLWRKEYPESVVSQRDDLPPCGTVCCIAGWAAQLSGIPCPAGETIGGHAETLLGLRDAQGNLAPEMDNGCDDPILFYTLDWPKEWLARMEEVCDDPAATTRVVAEFIDYVCGK